MRSWKSALFVLVCAAAAAPRALAADPALHPSDKPAGTGNYPGVPPAPSGATSNYPAAYYPSPPAPRIPEEVALPMPAPTWWDRSRLCFYKTHSVQQGMINRHHNRYWQYLDGEHHGYPYGCSGYEPRAVGASYTFPQWVPRRSVYYAYPPGGQNDTPYGFSPEPYYNTPR